MGGGVAADRAVEWLRILGQSIRDADVREEKADVLHAIYERVSVGTKVVVLR